jgi:hypothetical protein
MPVSADLEASFTAGGFDLTTAFSDLAALFTDVDLPGLDLDVSVSLTVEGVGTDAITEVLDTVTGGLGNITAGLPDVDTLLGPLRSAMRVPELIAGFDLDRLIADIPAAIRPEGPGLVPLVEAASSIGSVPVVATLSDLLGGLGLDVGGPGARLGGAAGGVVSLLQLLGALLAVESISRTIESRATLAADLLAADRLAGLITRVRAAGGVQLAGLLDGIDPDDADLVDLVAEPIEAYLGLVAELTGTLVRGLAFAEATVKDTDVAALAAALAVASAGLSEAALPPVRALIESAVPLVTPFLGIEVPAGGEDVVFGAVAELRTTIETTIDEFTPATIAALVTPATDPLLAPVRAVRQALGEIEAVIGVVFDPIEQALGAVDLDPVGDAIATVVDPVEDAVNAIRDVIATSHAAIEAAATAVHNALAPVRTTATTTVGTITAPFTDVHGVIAALDLEALQATIRSTLDAVTAAVSAAPVQPVFDVATGIIDTAADALGLVPKALLPDELRNELDAACAPVEALDLEPTRVELHGQLETMIASIDAGALDAAAAGYAAVRDFVASIDPHPHVESVETIAFAELTARLDAIDPTEILAPVTEALDAARAALDDVDIAALLAPIDEALDTVVATIEEVDPADLLEPVTSALAEATGAVRDALHLDDITATLDEFETTVTEFVDRVRTPITEALAAASVAWSDLLAGLRGDGGGDRAEADGGVVRGLLSALLPGLPVEGLPEVVAWIRGERDGAVVVRERLVRAHTVLQAAAEAIGTIDVRAITAELDSTHRALTTAVAAHADTSLLASRLTFAVGATNPGPDLGRVVLNTDGVSAAFAEAAAAVLTTTAADRSEVRITASGLGAALTPLSPALDKVRQLAAFVGIDPATIDGAAGARVALAALAERLGPDSIIGTLGSVLTHLTDRALTIIRDGLLAPLRGVVAELIGLLDALSLEPLVGRFTEIRDRLTGIVGGLRPSAVLAGPIAAFDAIKDTLAAFDPMGPARAVVDGLKSEITAFATDLAPSRLLAPVLTVYDDIAAGIGAFDVAGLVEPVLNALHEIGRIIDQGIDAVIAALGSLKAACESEGGPIPGLDLSIAASVDVGGSFGL